MSNQAIKLSVHQIIDFTMKTGSLDDSFAASNRAVLGTRAHQKLQKHRKKELGDAYCTEYNLSLLVEEEDLSFLIEGRADGIMIGETGVVLEEIKSTYCPLELVDEDFNMLHWAQAKLYAYIYCILEDIDEITVQLTYYNLDQEEHKSLAIAYTRKELTDFFQGILQKLCSWFGFIKANMDKRNKSIKELQFPFESYRSNQREFAVAVYKTIAESGNIFVQAPTGTGKTVSTLFPAVKSLGEGSITKIFYLTAKTITRQVAEDTIRLLARGGLDAKTVTITAKDKICFEKECSCRAESCAYAEGYFDRIDDAVRDILTNNEIIHRPVIEEYARKHRVCPFEFSLDLALWCDIVVCDYNYVFDPRAYLKRFFGEGNESADRRYVLLIDEAHNLVDRSREMYSASLSKSVILEQKRHFKALNKALYKTLTDINKYFIECKKSAEQKQQVSKEQPKELFPLLRSLVADFEAVIQQKGTILTEQSLTLYFDTMFFIRIYEAFDENYVTIAEIGRDVIIKLFCMDASMLLRERMSKAKSAVFFSATLLPLPYYIDLLGGNEESYNMKLSSVFPRENMGLCVVRSVSTRYKERESSVKQIAECIYHSIRHKVGNYLVYCSSYSYMQDIVGAFEEYNDDYDTIVQSQGMNEEDKEQFLERFQAGNSKTLVGFAVMGGAFSEGIDLTGDRLTGAIVVGVGLPQLCLERDVIMEYFDKHKAAGFDYAYRFPGMNKVQQAAGRVIRTEQDKGIIVLIDQRFDQWSYKKLYPKEWEGYRAVDNPKQLNEFIASFWDAH